MLCRRRRRRRCAVERDRMRESEREKESGRIEGEDRGGRIEKREAEIFGGCEDYRGKGWLCLPVKALRGW